jgi:hypothetical protein
LSVAAYGQDSGASEGGRADEAEVVHGAAGNLAEPQAAVEPLVGVAAEHEPDGRVQHVLRGELEGVVAAGCLCDLDVRDQPVPVPRFPLVDAAHDVAEGMFPVDADAGLYVVVGAAAVYLRPELPAELDRSWLVVRDRDDGDEPLALGDIAEAAARTSMSMVTGWCSPGR